MIRMTQAWMIVVAAAAIACGGSTDTDGSASGGGSGSGGSSGTGGSGAHAGSGDGGATCFANGQTYQPGDSFQNDCNTCTCGTNGDFACTKIACGGVCVYGGQTYPIGASFPAGDGCNTCSCGVGGEISCTLADCAPTCTYAGQTYTAGEAFPALDGCNKCVCESDGNVSCTEISCPCDPAQEWWRDYVGDSPAECAIILYGCPEQTQPFSNACGCGCEQDAACPPTIDCKPPGGCDEDLVKKCPYSAVSK